MLSSLQDLPPTLAMWSKTIQDEFPDLKTSNACLVDLLLLLEALREQKTVIWCSVHPLIPRHRARYSTLTLQFKSPSNRPALGRNCCYVHLTGGEREARRG